MQCKSHRIVCWWTGLLVKAFTHVFWGCEGLCLPCRAGVALLAASGEVGSRPSALLMESRPRRRGFRLCLHYLPASLEAPQDRHRFQLEPKQGLMQQTSDVFDLEVQNQSAGWEKPLLCSLWSLAPPAWPRYTRDRLRSIHGLAGWRALPF